jgi:hypothetical protein
VTTVFLALVGPASLAFAIFTAGRFWRWLAVLRDWAVADATVTAVAHGPTYPGVASRNRITYRFRAHTQEFSGHTVLPPGALCEPGNTLSIRYDPDNPLHSTIPESFSAFISAQLRTFLVGFFVIVLLAPLLARAFRLGE